MRQKNKIYRMLIFIGMVIFNLLMVFRFIARNNISILIEIIGYEDKVATWEELKVLLIFCFFVYGVPFLLINVSTYLLLKKDTQKYNVSAQSIESILKSKDAMNYINAVGNYQVEDLRYQLDRIRVECPSCGAVHEGVSLDTIKCGDHHFSIPKEDKKASYNQYGVLIGESK